MIHNKREKVNRPVSPQWDLAEFLGGIIVDGIGTVEEIEQEAQGMLEILERQWELMDAYQANLITEQELEDALLLLSLRVKRGAWCVVREST